jgi:O-methyltransferase involved in polyketide biosynthesis
MTEHRQAADLGDVQSTLFIPLTARARETGRAHPALRDPKAVEVLASVDFDAAMYAKGWNGWVTVPRTVIYDHWVRDFLGKNPEGTVVELGTGLNTRFERTDNGTVHWVDLDLPDVIELRRRFFADNDRRRMVAASLTSEEWLEAVAEFPGPYFLVAEGVLAYLSPEDVAATLTGITARFPGAFLAFDTCSRRVYDMQHKQAARKGMAARWAWACDDPTTLERYGLRLLETTTFTSPPPAVRRGLPARYRYLLPLAHTVFGKTFALNLFQAV